MTPFMWRASGLSTHTHITEQPGCDGCLCVCVCVRQNLTPETDNADGPGGEYAVLLKKLAAEDPPAFICHFYNVYFAHSAGGRMIGTKMSDMLLDGAKLQFYAYDGEMKDLLQVVKDNLNTVAEVCVSIYVRGCV
jgi:hypothetical protein